MKQSVALMATEGVALEFSDAGIRSIAKAAAEMNGSVENIGARRLHTIIEHVLADLSFDATDLPEEARTVVIDEAYVEKKLADVVTDQDLRRFIL